MTGPLHVGAVPADPAYLRAVVTVEMHEPNQHATVRITLTRADGTFDTHEVFIGGEERRAIITGLGGGPRDDRFPW